jgi:hypothetical protein
VDEKDDSVSGVKSAAREKRAALLMQGGVETGVLSALPDQADDKAHDGHDGEDEEKNLGDFNSACCNTAEAKYGCDQCDNQENDGIVQHLGLLCGGWGWRVVSFEIFF